MKDDKEKSMTVFEMPLICNEIVKGNLNKRMRVACDIYNDLNNFYQRRYRELTLSKEYVKDQKDLIMCHQIEDLYEEYKKDKKSHKKKEWDFEAWINLTSEIIKAKIKSNKEKLQLLSKEEDKEELVDEEFVEEELFDETDDSSNNKQFKLKSENKKLRRQLLFLKGFDSSSEEELIYRFKETAQTKKDIFDRRNKKCLELGLTEFGFRGEVSKYAKKYNHLVPSIMAARTVANRLWAGYQKLLYGNGAKVNYCKREFFNTLETDDKHGIKLLKDSRGLYLSLSNNRAEAKREPLKIYLRRSDSDYDDYYLRELEKNVEDKLYKTLKVIRIVRRFEKNHLLKNPHFYVQFTLENVTPYIKKNRDGSDKHIIKDGPVALSIWRNVLVAINNDEYKTWDLAAGEEEYAEKRASLQRKLEENRRTNNPDNYNEDGTIKKGRHTWNIDTDYIRLKNSISELSRKHTATSKLEKRHIVYELLKMGNSFTIYDTRYDIKRKKPSKESLEDLSQGELRKRARDRRAIQNGAPSTFKAYLQQKISMYKLEEIKSVRVPDDVFWYKHDVDSSSEDFFKNGSVRVNNIDVDSILYHAFILKHYDIENECLDKQEMETAFYKIFA